MIGVGVVAGVDFYQSWWPDVKPILRKCHWLRRCGGYCIFIFREVSKKFHFFTPALVRCGKTFQRRENHCSLHKNWFIYRFLINSMVKIVRIIKINSLRYGCICFLWTPYAVATVETSSKLEKFLDGTRSACQQKWNRHRQTTATGTRKDDGQRWSRSYVFLTEFFHLRFKPSCVGKWSWWNLSTIPFYSFLMFNIGQEYKNIAYFHPLDTPLDIQMKQVGRAAAILKFTQ